LETLFPPIAQIAIDWRVDRFFQVPYAPLRLEHKMVKKKKYEKKKNDF